MRRVVALEPNLSGHDLEWTSAGKEGNYPELMFQLFIKGRAVSTLNAYAGAFKRWEGFCKTEGIQRSLPVEGWGLAKTDRNQHGRHAFPLGEDLPTWT